MSNIDYWHLQTCLRKQIMQIRPTWFVISPRLSFLFILTFSSSALDKSVQVFIESFLVLDESVPLY
jgi:hypothetical protein